MPCRAVNRTAAGRSAQEQSATQQRCSVRAPEPGTRIRSPATRQSTEHRNAAQCSVVGCISLICRHPTRGRGHSTAATTLAQRARQPIDRVRGPPPLRPFLAGKAPRLELAGRQSVPVSAVLVELPTSVIMPEGCCYGGRPWQQDLRAGRAASRGAPCPHDK
jgi:hypothetical protein